MKTRDFVHPEYYAIPAYMILARKSPEDCAEHLNMSVRTYKEKIKGYYDFTAEQGRRLAIYLNRTQEELFLV